MAGHNIGKGMESLGKSKSKAPKGGGKAAGLKKTQDFKKTEAGKAAIEKGLQKALNADIAYKEAYEKIMPDLIKAVIDQNLILREKILVDEENTIIAGHARYRAAKNLGIEKVPTLLAKGWTEQQNVKLLEAQKKYPGVKFANFGKFNYETGRFASPEETFGRKRFANLPSDIQKRIKKYFGSIR